MDIVLRRASGIKRPRSDSFSSALAAEMPSSSISYSKKGRKPMYKKKPRYYRRLTLRTQLNTAQNRVHRMVQSGQLSLPINALTGFATVAADPALQVVFNESSVQFAVGTGAFSAATNFPNAASYAAVFDQWRLDKVVCQVLFSSNSSAVNTNNQFPIVYGVIDVNDTNPITSTDNALVYGNCRIMQMGTSSGPTAGIQTMILSAPMVKEDAQTTTGTLLTAISRRSPWLSTQNPSIQHNAYKFFVATPGGTNAIVGYITLIFRCFYSFKNIV